mmetsp:Transcript_13367/g.28590  ORF Transcript_13367/g.28590 Transcript_13367/m.28590 type:complete len:895 (+) Transcript_13367:99-2783(+)
MTVPTPPTTEAATPVAQTISPPGGVPPTPGESKTAKPGPTPQPCDHVVTLVSNTVVNQRAFANNNGIPVAAMVDLYPPASLQLPQVARQPVRCKSCSAYMNVYCKTNLAKNVWKCNLCGQANITQDLPSADPSNYAELCEEAVEYVFPRPAGAPPLESPGSAPPPHIVLVLDSTLGVNSLAGATSAIREALSGADPAAVVSVVTFDGVVCLHGLRPAEDSKDDNGIPTPLHSVKVHALPSGGSIDPALLSMYVGPDPLKSELVSELASCLPHRLEQVLGAIRPLEQEKPIRQRARGTLAGVEAAVHLMALFAGAWWQRQQQQQQGEQQRRRRVKAGPGSRIILLVGGPATKGPGAVPLEVVDAGAGALEAGTPGASGLGLSRENLQAAAAARQAATNLARMANSVGAPVNIFLGAEVSSNVPLLALLAHESGGELVSQRGFGPLFPAALKAVLSRRFGTYGIIDCFVSEGARLVQWMGPVEVLDPATLVDPALNGVQDRRLSSSACSISSLQSGNGVALRLELTRDLEVPVLILQVVLQFIDHSIGGRVVQRVATRRIHVVSTLNEYVRSINPVAAAVVAAKRTVLEAKKVGAARDKRKAEELRYALAAQLSLVASRTGRQVQVSSGMLGFGARKHWQLPRELLPLAAALYHLARGPMLGAAAVSLEAFLGPDRLSSQAVRAHEQHPDARLLLMNTLLAACGQVSSLMIVPQLYLVHQQEGQWVLQPLPPVDMAAALYAAHTLLLDCGCTIMLLPPKGSSVQPNGQAQLEPSLWTAVMAHVSRLSAARFPIPELLVMPASLDERAALPSPTSTASIPAGGGMEALLSRLLPIHRDSVAEQALQFPGLRELPEEHIKELSEALAAPTGSGLATYSSQTLAQWARAAGVEVYPRHN